MKISLKMTVRTQKIIPKELTSEIFYMHPLNKNKEKKNRKIHSTIGNTNSGCH